MARPNSTATCVSSSFASNSLCTRLPSSLYYTSHTLYLIHSPVKRCNQNQARHTQARLLAHSLVHTLTPSLLQRHPHTPGMSSDRKSLAAPAAAAANPKRKIQTLAKQEESKKEEGKKKKCKLCGRWNGVTLNENGICGPCEAHVTSRVTIHDCSGCGRVTSNTGICNKCLLDEINGGANEEKEAEDLSKSDSEEEDVEEEEEEEEEERLVEDEAEEAGSSEEEEEEEDDSPLPDDVDDEEEDGPPKKKSRLQKKWEQGDHLTQRDMEKYALVVTKNTMYRVFLAAPDDEEDDEHMHIERLEDATDKTAASTVERVQNALADMKALYPGAWEVCDDRTDFKGDLLVQIFRV